MEVETDVSHFAALGCIHGIGAVLGVAPIISILKNLKNKIFVNLSMIIHMIEAAVKVIEVRDAIIIMRKIRYCAAWE